MTIRLATKRAEQSKFRRARVGAVIEKSGRVLVSGCNRIGYTKLVRDRKSPDSLHAEQNAIVQMLKNKRQDELIGSTLYVSRIGIKGECRMAKPCKYCHNLIEAVGIRRVYYTTEAGVESYEV